MSEKDIILQSYIYYEQNNNTSSPSFGIRTGEVITH